MKLVKIDDDVKEQLDRLKNGRNAKYSDIIKWALSQADPKMYIIQRVRQFEEEADRILPQYCSVFQAACVVVNIGLKLPPDEAQRFALSVIKHSRKTIEDDDKG